MCRGLEPDAFMAIIAYVDKKMVRATSARGRKKGTQGSVAILKEKKTSKVVYLKTQCCSPSGLKMGSVISSSSSFHVVSWKFGSVRSLTLTSRMPSLLPIPMTSFCSLFGMRPTRNFPLLFNPGTATCTPTLQALINGIADVTDTLHGQLTTLLSMSQKHLCSAIFNPPTHTHQKTCPYHKKPTWCGHHRRTRDTRVHVRIHPGTFLVITIRTGNQSASHRPDETEVEEVRLFRRPPGLRTLCFVDTRI